jgi:phosphoglycolate phosphatase
MDIKTAKKYKQLIWDWNGTLFNDTELSLEIINSILTKRKLQALTLKNYRKIFTFPVKEYYEKAGLDFEKYSFEELGNEWMREYENRKLEADLHDGAKDLLKYIAGKSIQQAILSAYSQHTLIEIVKYFQIDQYFSHLVGLDHIYATSKIEIGKKLMTQLKYKPNEVVLIGDTVHDYEVAKEIGIGCILLANGHQSKEKLLSCNAEVYDSLTDLYEVL